MVYHRPSSAMAALRLLLRDLENREGPLGASRASPNAPTFGALTLEEQR